MRQMATQQATDLFLIVIASNWVFEIAISTDYSSNMICDFVRSNDFSCHVKKNKKKRFYLWCQLEQITEVRFKSNIILSAFYLILISNVWMMDIEHWMIALCFIYDASIHAILVDDLERARLAWYRAMCFYWIMLLSFFPLTQERRRLILLPDIMWRGLAAASHNHYSDRKKTSSFISPKMELNCRHLRFTNILLLSFAVYVVESNASNIPRMILEVTTADSRSYHYPPTGIALVRNLTLSPSVMVIRLLWSALCIHIQPEVCSAFH